MTQTEYLNELQNSRLDRLNEFYNDLKSPNEFSDFYYNGSEYYIPEEIPYDKNLYTHYLRYPINEAKRKIYVFKLYGKYYKFYRTNNNFHFISTKSQDAESNEYAFGLSIAYSYVAMAFYEIIKWITSKKCCNGPINIVDRVFDPIFRIPEYNDQNSPYILRLSMYPIPQKDSNTINLSIFN